MTIATVALKPDEHFIQRLKLHRSENVKVNTQTAMGIDSRKFDVAVAFQFSIPEIVSRDLNGIISDRIGGAIDDFTNQIEIMLKELKNCT